MNKKLFGVITILAVFFVLVMLKYPSGKDRIVERLNREHAKQLRKDKRRIDSLENELTNLAIIYGNLKKEVEEAKRSRTDKVKVYEKIIYRAYTNPERDSILLKLYPIGAANIKNRPE